MDVRATKLSNPTAVEMESKPDVFSESDVHESTPLSMSNLSNMSSESFVGQSYDSFDRNVTALDGVGSTSSDSASYDSVTDLLRSSTGDISYDIPKYGSDGDSDSVFDYFGNNTIDGVKLLRNLRQDDSPFYSNKKPVLYEGNSHLGVICQLHGSVWKYVLPYCIVNVMWTYFISYLLVQHNVDITVPSSGHKFMVILVSFLVVSRVQITYSRFIEARKYLGGCFRSSRELMHDTCILTLDSEGAEVTEWRKRVAEKILRMLRITIAAIEFSSKGVDPWIFLPKEKEICPHTKPVAELRHFLRTKSSHREQTKKHDALRAPLVYSGIIRAEVLSPRKTTFLRRPMTGPEELKLLGHATEFTSAYHGLIKLITTPFPFPLVQKTRTILFVWLFTLPLSLMKDAGNPWEDMIMIFFVTYGFLGLEYVSIELDDPFGNDDNDFDNLGMAQRVYEDIYITLLDSDGLKAAESLRETMSEVQPQKENINENNGHEFV